MSEAGRYCIWIVSPPGYPHSRCFEEVALALREAFAALGYDAPIVTDFARIQGQAVVLGANLLSSAEPARRPHLILYNLEQVTEGSPWMTAGYLEILRRHAVWDYSAANVEALSRYGVRAALCGIGYMPGLSRITAADEQDIDVIFVGSPNERRRRVMQQLANAGLKVAARFNCYGEERDHLLARAKLALNMHFYESKVLEIVRVSYLLANGICVVSETGGDINLEEPLREAIAFAPYPDLVKTCLNLLADDDRRRRQAQRGFDIFSAQSQTAMLARALNSLQGSGACL